MLRNFVDLQLVNVEYEDNLPIKIEYSFKDYSKKYVAYFKKEQIIIYSCAADKKAKNLLKIEYKLKITDFAAVVASVAGQVHKIANLSLYNKKDDIAIPLFASNNLKDLLIYWRLWSQKLKLPMYLQNSDKSFALIYEKSAKSYLLPYRNKLDFSIKFAKSKDIKLKIKQQLLLA